VRTSDGGSQLSKPDVASRWPSCAVALLRRARPAVVDEYRPLMVAGDGNCLYRSVSLLLYGTDSYHELLRLTTAAEILSNQQWYDTKHPNCRRPFKDERRLFLPQYQQLCADTATDGAYSNMLTIHTPRVAQLTGLYRRFFPPLRSGGLDASPYTRLMNCAVPGRPLTVMWSTAGKVPAVGQVDINHFVPLVKIQWAGCGVAPAVMQVDDTVSSASCTRSETHTLLQQVWQYVCQLYITRSHGSARVTFIVALTTMGEGEI